MPIQYKLVTAFLALTGCVSLLITGEVNLLMCTGGLALFPGYYRFFKDRPQASKRVAAVLAQTVLLVFLADAFVISGDVFLAVAHLTIIFQGIKSFDLKEPWDHLQVYFMSLLQLVIASELTRSLLFGVVFVIFLMVMVAAMILSHYLKEGSLGRTKIARPITIITALTLLLTAFFFIAIPRTPQRLIGKGHARGIKTVGFSDQVDFGSFGELKLNPTVVMRIVFDRRPSFALYWRGLSMDFFDGQSWSMTDQSRSRIFREDEIFRILRVGPGENTVSQEIYLEPIDTNVLFGLSAVAEVEADMYFLQEDSAQGIFSPGTGARRVRYTVLSLPNVALPGRGESRYLQIPLEMERVAAFGATIAGGIGNDLEKAMAIERYLKTNYVYSLETAPPPPGITAVEDFVFNTRKGFCEHYATAMVLMLRGIGIPARIVNGFYGGEWNEYGNYLLVRQRDAHSWVEALVGGRWMRYDPTPAAPATTPPAITLVLDSIRMGWSRYVVGYSSSDQRFMLRASYAALRRLGDLRLDLPSVGRWLALAVAGAVVSLVLFYLFTARRPVWRNPLTRDYMKLRKALKKKGFPDTQTITAADVRDFAGHFGLGPDLCTFLDHYERYRFSGTPLTYETRRYSREILRAIEKKLSRMNPLPNIDSKRRMKRMSKSR